MKKYTNFSLKNKELLPIIFFILSFSLIVPKTNAQKAYIPDSNFRSWINTNYPGSIVGDSLITTFSSVINAQNIDVTFKNIADLTGIQYFTSLKNLDVSYNNLISLPQLPNGLDKLTCGSNQITGFSELPSNLTVLDFINNKIITLPELPSNLTSLNCSYNKIITLPELPSNLSYLRCSYN